jgi:hypothetical protein
MALFQRLPSCLAALGLLVLSGCGGKLKRDETFTIKDTDVEIIPLDAPLVDKAIVTVKAPRVPVRVYVVYMTHVEAAKKTLQEFGIPKEVIVGTKDREGIEDQSFEFAPGRKPFAVLITPVKRGGEIHVTATGQ